MVKSNKKFKGIVKGAALGFALIMASAFFPANAIANAEDYTNGDLARLNTSRIQVDGQNQSFSVKRGDTVSIPEAEYAYKKANGTQGAHKIGSTLDADATAAKITSSTVEVFYKATGDKVAVESNSFVAEKVGTYVISYTVVVDGVPYSYEQLVTSQASEASFEFKQNDKNVIPSVYDVSIADKKDVVLPLPTINDENEEAILTSNDEDYYVLNRDTTSLPTENSKNVYVSISLANGSEKVAIQSRTNEAGEKEFYISGENLSKLDDKDEAELDGEELKILYSFYQKTANGDVFVSSTSRTFTVETKYYKKSNKADAEKGYDLVASFSGTKPDSAVVGVEKELPKITATTSSSNSPKTENVEVYYQIVVYKQNENGNYNDENDVTASVITEDGKFKAIEEGSYKFVYKVSDFYGNKATESNTTFTINRVKDSVAATAYIYDASNSNAYDKENNKYESAENLLKNQTVNRNIIMYAVGGTDNMVKRYEDLTDNEKENGTNYISLRRVIKDNSGIDRFVIDNEVYNAYNLIFAPGVVSGSTSSVWQAIVSDNYQLYKQMITEETPIDVTDDDAIKQYLLDNNYLLVTTKFNKDIDGNDIVDGLSEDDEEATAKMLEKGYAYVAPKTSNYSFENKEGTYTFYYYAKDNVNSNKESSIYFTVKLSNSFEDESVPTITFSSDLQSAYLPSESFEFKVATATDSVSSRLTTVTAYRYLDANKVAMPKSETAGTTQTLNYVVMNANTSLMKPTAEGGKWYAQKGIVSSEGWFVDSVASSYKVDLTKRPAGANYVEILAYAIDDYGNVGFFNKVVRVADTTDTEAPVLYKVMNAPETTAEYTAPEQIVLPTLYFADANANYMHAQVNVYRLIKDKDGVVTGKTLVQSSGMKTTYDTQREYFKVDAGIFNATTEGDYQVTVTVSDSGNHSVTSYFAYSVEAGENTETPKIDNISSDSIELEPGKAHYLVPPTFTMIENDKYGYVGIDDQDDAYTSTHYNVSVVSASSSDYELDESYFIGNREGTYQLQYTAFLIQYEKDALVDSSNKENGKLFFENGKLKFQSAGVEYFVYIDQDANNALVANTSLQGNGTALADMTALNDIATVYVDQSEVQVIKVSEVFINVHIDEDAYATNKFEQLGQKVRIVKPSVEFKGNGAEMNKKESTVSISRTSGGTTTNIATINFEEWENVVKDNTTGNFEVNGSDIYLILKDNGEYKIKYSIQAQTAEGQNIGDPNTEYSYTISSGDTKKPEIDIENTKVTKDEYGNIKQKFNIGDKVVIDMAAITVSDNFTTDRDDLLERLTVTVKNTTLNESSKTLENKATEEGKYIYETDKLETAGDYVITFTVRDEAGNISEQTTVNFEVSTSESDPVDTKEVMGGILIGVSVALLVGVVGYFVVSKVKLDKKEKSYKNAGKDRKKND